MKKLQSKSKYLSDYTDYLELCNYSPKTIESYTGALSGFFNYVSSLNNNDGDYIDYSKSYLLSLKRKQRSWSTINLYYSSLKLFCKNILNKDWDIENLKRPRTEKRLTRIMSMQEIRLMIQSTNSLKHRAILYLFYATGIRISELTNLKIGDIDSDRHELFVRKGKGNKDRVVDVPPCVIPILRMYYKQYKPKQYLFEGMSKTRLQYSHSSIHKILKRSKTKAKIRKKISAHTLRHSYATHHLENGTDLVYIKEQLGHTNLSTTEKYLHLCGSRRRQIHHPIESLQIDLLESTL